MKVATEYLQQSRCEGLQIEKLKLEQNLMIEYLQYMHLIFSQNTIWQLRKRLKKKVISETSQNVFCEKGLSKHLIAILF